VYHHSLTVVIQYITIDQIEQTIEQITYNILPLDLFDQHYRKGLSRETRFVKSGQK
jgi:hypothetical protein